MDARKIEQHHVSLSINCEFRDEDGHTNKLKRIRLTNASPTRVYGSISRVSIRVPMSEVGQSRRLSDVGMSASIVSGLLAANLVLASGLVCAAGQYGPGASDTEIKVGQTMPYSGPASAYGIIGRSEAAYFAMINDQGGINGRKIHFISRDDGYSPPKTVEVVRKMVEEDQVLLTFNVLGTPPNTAIRGYLNDNKVPQLFVATGADKWNEPKNYPWTMGWQPSYRIEARIYARYILQNLPDAKVAVLYQNDDAGKDYLIGLREGLGPKADKMIVATKTYETTDPTVDSQIVALQGSGANVLVMQPFPNSPRRRSARSMTSAGSRPTSSPTCRFRSRR